MSRSERMPILPGSLNANIGPSVNRVLEEGPEFLDLEWLNRDYQTIQDLRHAFLANDGMFSQYVLQGAITAPIVRNAIHNSFLRPPFGLERDLNRGVSNDIKRLVPMVSFTNLRNARFELLDPFEALRNSVDDTLRLEMKDRLDMLAYAAEQEPESKEGRLYERFNRLDMLIKGFSPPKSPSLRSQLFNGIGSGTSAVAASLKVIPELLKIDPEYQLTFKENPEAIAFAKQVAQDSYPFIAEVATLDESAFISIQIPLFGSVLSAFSEDMLNNYQLRKVGGKVILDFSDTTKFAIQINNEGSIFRYGCPFMAAVDRKNLPASDNALQKPKVAGVEELVRWMIPFGGKVYAEQYLHAA